MKKAILTLSLLVSIIYFSQAQNYFEGGLRFGGGFNNNVALDFTLPLAAKPRLHPTLYFDNNGVTIGTYFDWMFNVEDAEGLRLYPGVGPELYLYNNNTDLGIAGNFGIEYVFDIPLTVGFDWRPAVIVTGPGDFNTDNWGIMIRYRFN